MTEFDLKCKIGQWYEAKHRLERLLDGDAKGKADLLDHIDRCLEEMAHDLARFQFPHGVPA